MPVEATRISMKIVLIHGVLRELQEFLTPTAAEYPAMPQHGSF
jgi:hypothetical protein